MEKKRNQTTPPEELRQFDLRTGSSPGSSVESVGLPQITIIFFFGWFHQVQKETGDLFQDFWYRVLGCSWYLVHGLLPP